MHLYPFLICSFFLLLTFKVEAKVTATTFFLRTTPPVADPADSLHARKYEQKALEFQSNYEHDSAIYYLNRSLVIYQELQLWDKCLVLQRHLSNCYLRSSETKKAAVSIQEAEKLYRKQFPGQEKHLLPLLQAKAFMYYTIQKYDSAIAAVDQILQIQKGFFEKKDTLDLIKTYNRLGILYGKRRDLRPGLLYYDSALTLLSAKGMDHSRLAGDIYYNKATIYRKLGNYTTGLNYYQRSLDITRSLFGEVHFDLATGMRNMANLYLERNQNKEDLKKAIELYDQSIAIVTQHYPKTNQLKYWQIGYANIYFELAQYDRAIHYSYKAIESFEKEGQANGIDIAYCYRRLGAAYLEKEESEKAEEYLKKSISIFTNEQNKGNKEIAYGYILLSKLLAKEKRYEESLHYLNTCLQTFIPAFKATHALNNPAAEQLIIFDTYLYDGMLQKALVLDQFYEHTKDIKYLKASLDTYSVLFEIFNQAKKETINFSSKANFIALGNKNYQEAVVTALKCYRQSGEQEDLWKAFLFSDAKRTNLLSEELVKNKANMFSNIPLSLLEEEKHIRLSVEEIKKRLYDNSSGATNVPPNEVESLKIALFEQQKKQERLEKDIAREFPAYHHFKYGKDSLSLVDLQTALDPSRDALIEYCFTDSLLYAFVLMGNSLEILELGTKKDLEHEIITYQAVIRNLEQEEFAETSFLLYQKLLHPVLESLRQLSLAPEHLLIIPDGPLAYLSFETLVREPAVKSGGYKTLSYVLQDYIISYQHSANLMAFNKVFTKGTNRLPYNNFIGFAPGFSEGNSSLLANRSATTGGIPHQNLLQLPGSVTEVAGIAQLLGGQSYAGSQATEQAFKKLSAEADIIHLATHAIIDPDNPLYSSLVFTDSQDSLEDGKLHMYELYNMKLQANLVCLSACNSGVGKIYKGEGAMSLARGFMYAGVPNVVMSLWQVPDQSTAQLMEYFYQGMHEGKSKAEALRAAKLKYLSDADGNTANPYYWGAFLYVGNIKESNQETLPWEASVGVLALFFFMLGFLFYRHKRSL